MSDLTESTPVSDDGWLDRDPQAPPKENYAANADLKDLLDFVEIEVLNWIPEPGDVLAGTLFDVKEVDSDYHKDRGGRVPMLIVRAPSGRYYGVRCYSTVLLKEVDFKLNTGRLNAGDIIAIKYVGKRPGGLGDEYDDFRFTSRKPASSAKPVR